MLNNQTITDFVRTKYQNALNDDFYVIIESDGTNNPRILTDDSGYTLKYRNLDILRGVIKTLNQSQLTHYYFEKITL